MTVRRLLLLLAFLGAPACRCDRAPSGESGPITTPPPAATARRLAPITGPVSGMVLDDTHAFLSAEGAGSIVRVAKTSGDVKVLATREPGPQALALAGSTVVWLDMGDLFRGRDGAGFVRLAKDGTGAPTKAAWKPSGRTDICPVGDAVVLCKEAIVRVERDGTTRILASVPGGSCGLAACDATYAYVGTNGKAYRARLESKDAPAAELFASSADYLHALAVAGSDVYWADKNGVQKTPAAGGAATPVATLAEPTALAVDDANVYVATLDGTIHRVPRAGGSPVAIATTTPPVRVLRTDAADIYWTTDDGLWTLRKSP